MDRVACGTRGGGKEGESIHKPLPNHGGCIAMRVLLKPASPASRLHGWAPLQRPAASMGPRRGGPHCRWPHPAVRRVHAMKKGPQLTELRHALKAGQAACSVRQRGGQGVQLLGACAGAAAVLPPCRLTLFPSASHLPQATSTRGKAHDRQVSRASAPGNATPPTRPLASPSGWSEPKTGPTSVATAWGASHRGRPGTRSLLLRQTCCSAPQAWQVQPVVRANQALAAPAAPRSQKPEAKRELPPSRNSPATEPIGGCSVSR